MRNFTYGNNLLFKRADLESKNIAIYYAEHLVTSCIFKDLKYSLIK